MASLDRETLEAALIGYEQQKIAIDFKIAQLKAHLGGHVAPAASSPTKKGRKKFSAETRMKMAAAQQKRWAAKNGSDAPETPTKKATVKKRRTLSPEARESIAAAQRKRWAKSKKAAKKAA